MVKLKNYVGTGFFAILIGVALITGCKKNSPSISPQAGGLEPLPNSASSRMTRPEEFMTFENTQDFEEQLDELLAMQSNTTINAWEDENSFFSMRRAFDEVVDAEMALSNRLDSLSQDSIDYYKTQPNIVM